MAGDSGRVAAVSTWRQWPKRLMRLWRESLQFRTVLLTLALSGVAILVIGLYISLSISANLFQTRLDQVLDASNRANLSAQTILEASDAADRAAAQSVFRAAQDAIVSTSSSRTFALFRVPGQDSSPVAPLDVVSPDLTGVITSELRTSVQENPGALYWQSVSLANTEGELVPGIVVGSQLEMPSAGRYELYIGYSLEDAERTLQFMQVTGVAGAVALMLLLAGSILLVVRWVIEPIRAAAQTSRRLADGELDVRMPEKGDDELATLAKSFNAMAESLQAQIRELADLSVMQQRFVSDVSHELRTPLTTIRLAGDVLYEQRAEFSSTTSRTVELLYTQTKRFERLLADLLEISRYDAGSVTLEAEPTNLVHLAEDAIESVRALAEQRGSDLQLDAPGGYLEAELDPRRIRRIVRNLLGNAIEHGEGRPIVVSVDSDEHAVALSVRDFGVGMTEDETARAFDRFWRSDPSRTRTIGGTGLGLAIALEDAAVHGGRLDLWSKPGEGSCFRLTLPRTLGEVLTGSPLPLPSDGAAGPSDIVWQTRHSDDAASPAEDDHAE